jgi:hypothetical protein
VTHLAVTPLAGRPERAYAAASKQIYGTHYFDSSLGITVLVDAPNSSGPGMFLAYVNRSRLDALRGFFGGLKRSVVRSRARSAIGEGLIEARSLVERRYRERAAQSVRRGAPAAPHRTQSGRLLGARGWADHGDLGNSGHCCRATALSIQGRGLLTQCVEWLCRLADTADTVVTGYPSRPGERTLRSCGALSSASSLRSGPSSGSWC